MNNKSFFQIVAIIFILSFSLKIKGQITQTIRGTVIEQHTKMPLSGVTILLITDELQKGTITDADGFFKLENISIGRISLSISYIGFEPQQINNILLSSGKELLLNIELVEQVLEIGEIQVVANAKHETVNKMASLSARSFTVEETQKYAGTRNDPSRMVANYAGVMAAGDQRNDIIIRGNSPLGLLWQMNGVNIPNPNHFGGLGTTGGPISMINSKMLKNSDFFTGAFPAEYGNALSGAFDLHMRSGNNWKRENMVQFSFDGVELGMEGPFLKSNSNATYLVNYRYSTWEIFDALGIRFGPPAVPKYQDGAFKVDFLKTKLGKISLWGFGGTNSIEMLQSEKDPGDWSFGKSASDRYLSSQTGVIGLSHLFFINNKTWIISNLSASGYAIEQKRDSVNIESFIAMPVFRNNSSEIITTLSTKLKIKFNSQNYASTGISYNLYNVNYSDSMLNRELGSFKTITDIENKNIGLLETFIQWQHKFSNKLELYTGLHHQFFTLNSNQSLEPRLNLTFNFAKNQSLGFSYGLHSQMQARPIYFNNEAVDVLGNNINTNEELDFSKAHHFILGYNNILATNLRFKLETYYQYLYNIPVDKNQGYYSMLNSGDFFRILSRSNLQNDGTGKNYGVELTFEKFLSRNYYFLLTTSLFQSKYKGSDGIERNTAFNGNYVFNALGGYELKLKNNKFLNFDLNNTFAGGKRYIPINEEASNSIGTVIYNYDNAYEDQYSGYMRLDLKISYKVNKPKLAYTFSLDIQNVTNHKNIFTQYYDAQSGKYETDYQQGMFPLFQFKIEF